MDEIPTLSIILPVYNAAAHLREAYESLLNQTFQDFEIIVIDDGSRDGSIEIIRSYRDSRTLILTQENQGIAVALNNGIERACGQFIARMDGDDVSHPQRFEKQINFLTQHPEIGVLGSDFYQIDAGGRIKSLWHMPHSDSQIRRVMIKRNPVAHPSVVIRKEVFHLVGLYDPQWVPIEDWELWFRVSTFTKLANWPEPLLYWRVHPKSTTDGLRSLQVRKGFALRVEAVKRGWVPKTAFIHLLKPAVLAMLPGALQNRLVQLRTKEFDVYLK